MQKTIPVNQLRPGMYLLKLCGSWMQHPFWRTSFLIEDRETIRVIVDSGIDKVIIDTRRGLDVPAGVGEATPTVELVADEGEPARDPPADASETSLIQELGSSGSDDVGAASFEAEIVRARKLCIESKEVIAEMLREARMGHSINADAALPLVEEIASSVLRNSSALISVARLKTADDYSYMHSVAVCALMVSLSRQLGLDEEQTRVAGMGGLMHDVGKAMMPLEVLNKPGKLTDAEYAIMKQHPEEGHALLLKSGMANTHVLDIALHHHERIDGTGYPHRLAGDDISQLARMGAVCDVYDAVTSNRPYKAGWDPAESIRQMTSWKGHFDTTVLKAFIRSVGIYPIGALVRLASDKIGVVIEQHPESFLKPTVQVFYSAKSRSQILLHRVDLAAPDGQDRIVSVESPAKWGFKNLERLWMP